MEILYEIEKDSVNILIPEGKTMLRDGREIPAPNWRCSIPLTDTNALIEYFSLKEINFMQKSGE